MIPLVLGRRPSGHDPCAEGARARVAGVPRAECPYPHACPEAAAWRCGWDRERTAAGEAA